MCIVQRILKHVCTQPIDLDSGSFNKEIMHQCLPRTGLLNLTVYNPEDDEGTDDVLSKDLLSILKTTHMLRLHTLLTEDQASED